MHAVTLACTLCNCIRYSFLTTCLKNVSISPKKRKGYQLNASSIWRSANVGNNKEKLLSLLQTCILIVVVMVVANVSFKTYQGGLFTWMWLNSGSPTKWCLCIMCGSYVCLCPSQFMWPWTSMACMVLSFSRHTKRLGFVEVKLLRNRNWDNYLMRFLYMIQNVLDYIMACHLTF